VILEKPMILMVSTETVEQGHIITEKQKQRQLGREYRKIVKNLDSLKQLLAKKLNGKRVTPAQLYKANNEISDSLNFLHKEVEALQKVCPHKRTKDLGGFDYFLEQCLNCGAIQGR